MGELRIRNEINRDKEMGRDSNVGNNLEMLLRL